MREVLDLFSAAAGGWSLGMHRAGFRTIAACEVVDWRRALYAENNPDVLLYDDVRTLTADRLLRDLGRLPSIVVGSPPCQDISSANTKGKGVDGERSSLYFEAIRIIGEVRPRWFAFENSANLRTRGADRVIAALEALGYTCWAFVVGADDVGANHERKRSWLIGCDIDQIADVSSVGFDPWAGLSGSTERNEPSDVSGDAAGLGRGQGWAGRCSGAVAGADEPACGADADAHRDAVRIAELPGRPGQEAPVAGNANQYEATYSNRHRQHAPSLDGEMAELRGLGGHRGRSARNTPDPDQARRRADRQTRWPSLVGKAERAAADGAHGSGEPGGSSEGGHVGQMAVCPPDRSGVGGSRADWSLADLARHIRLDDGLPAWLAGQRVEIGDGRGASAASLIVEAFGDAVCPQIPEAIGRAMIRVEQALSIVGFAA